MVSPKPWQTPRRRISGGTEPVCARILLSAVNSASPPASEPVWAVASVSDPTSLGFLPGTDHSPATSGWARPGALPGTGPGLLGVASPNVKKALLLRYPLPPYRPPGVRS